MALPLLLLAAGVQASPAIFDGDCVSVSVRYPEGAGCAGGSFAMRSVELSAPAALADARATRAGAQWKPSSVIKVRIACVAVQPTCSPASSRGSPVITCLTARA